MSKPFDYSKWDNIELSDDEEDCHPNIEKESWFRMKHRSRVEREENEAKDKAKILKEMEESNKRIKFLEHDLSKLSTGKEKKADDGDDDDDSDDDDDDDDLEREGIEVELAELKAQNAARQAKLDEYEKNKKWNIDNMFQVKDERTMVNPAAAKADYTETGFAVPKEELKSTTAAATTTTSTTKEASASKSTGSSAAKAKTTSSTTASKPAASAKKAPPSSSSSSSSTALAKSSAGPAKAPSPPNSADAMETYVDFTDKYADLVEEFMAIPDLAGSRDFLLKHGDALLQENASNYLLLASLEDEMNGYRDKMKRTARQSQIISNIAELAKSVKTHPGNVIMPFFARLEQREHLDEFIKGVNAFADKIIARAVVKKKEIDEARRLEEAEAAAEASPEGVPKALQDIPREERLGPGGLDPLEVIETLPADMVAAFESRDVEDLKRALMKLDPAEAENHMKRCIASGLWVNNG